MKPIDGKTIVMAGEPLHGNPERKIRKLVENGYTSFYLSTRPYC